MRLLWVEIRRLFARRFFWIGSVALLIGLCAVLAATAYDSQVPTAADRAQAQRRADASVPQVQADLERCEAEQRAQPTATPGAEPSSPPSTKKFRPGFDCNLIVAPGSEAFLDSNPFRFTRAMDDRTLVLTLVLALFAFLVGATAVGAEWHHGTLAALLVWEPRRMRVFLTKLLALLFGVTVVSAVGYAANVAGHWAVAELTGIVGDITPEFQRKIALSAARGLGATLAAAAVGFAIAFTLRRTAAALGAAIAYLGVVEIGVRTFVTDAPRFLVSTYVQAWLLRGRTIFVYDCGQIGCREESIHIRMSVGGLYLAVVALVLLTVAAAVFRRREVS
jgi:ABC-2 type transport system permease protein